jgi:hypothetical protein
MLRDYYTVGVPSTGAIARVDDRFPQWVTRTDPPIPFTGAGGVTLDPSARNWIRVYVHNGVWNLLGLARAGANPAKFGAATPGILTELNGPWNGKMIDELADRFYAFLTDGLAGRTPTWPGQPPAPVAYAGYDWAPPLLATAVAAGPDDLAAVAQFHLNWRQPHRELRRTDRLLRPLLPRDPAGPAASVVAGGAAGTNRVQVDEFVGLRNVQPSATGDHADLLRLAGDTARASKTYRILAADPASRTLTVDGIPVIGAASAWQVIRRPRLVVVDPFGARLAGSAASPTAATARDIRGSWSMWAASRQRAPRSRGGSMMLA